VPSLHKRISGGLSKTISGVVAGLISWTPNPKDIKRARPPRKKLEKKSYSDLIII